MRYFLARVIIERCQGAEVGLKTVASDVVASTDCASEDPTVGRDNQPFTLPAEENDGAVCACAASGTPGASGVTLDMPGQSLKRINPLCRVARQRLDVLNRLTEHLARLSRRQLRYKVSPWCFMHEGPHCSRGDQIRTGDLLLPRQAR